LSIFLFLCGFAGFAFAPLIGLAVFVGWCIFIVMPARAYIDRKFYRKLEEAQTGGTLAEILYDPVTRRDPDANSCGRSFKKYKIKKRVISKKRIKQ
jgi:hypothetical protein